MNLNPISNPPFQTIQPEFIAQLQKVAGGDNGFLSEFQFIMARSFFRSTRRLQSGKCYSSSRCYAFVLGIYGEECH